MKRTEISKADQKIKLPIKSQKIKRSIKHQEAKVAHQASSGFVKMQRSTASTSSAAAPRHQSTPQSGPINASGKSNQDVEKVLHHQGDQHQQGEAVSHQLAGGVASHAGAKIAAANSKVGIKVMRVTQTAKRVKKSW